MKKHLLFILTAYPNLGGIETVTNILSQELIKRYGCEIDIVTFNYKKEYENLIPNEVRVHELSNRGGYQSSENKEFIEGVAQERSSEVIIYQDSYAPSELIVINAAQNLGLPLIVFDHNTPDYGCKISHYSSIISAEKFGLKQVLDSMVKYVRMYRNKHRLVKRKKFIYDNCDKYVLLSKAFYPIMNRLVPQSKESKLTAISNPIKNCEREIINKENIIFCAARLVPQKNIAEMLYIWSKIQPQHEDWRFIIAGTGSEEQMLKAKSQTLQLKNIDFVGYVNPKEYYQKAKIFWMTSLFEGFGMTLVEAQSYGCVPVAYDSFASLHDIIDSEVNGLIIPFGNRKQFEEETIKLINNPEKFKRLSESAQESVGRFDIDIIVEQWRQLLETI